MYEVFPVLAGIVLALVVPRLADSVARRRLVYGVLGVVVAVLATVIAAEEWFFMVVDLAEVLLAIGLTSAVKARLSPGEPARRTVEAEIT